MTLCELTGGYESGIIIRENKYAMIYYGANRSEAEDDCLPYVDPLGTDIIWWKQNYSFDDAKVEEVDNFRDLFDPNDYDADDKWDHGNRFDETCSDGTGRATIITFADGTVVIAPKDWN